MMKNTRKPSLERLEDRNLMSTITINWAPSCPAFQYGTKLGPAELNASVHSTGSQNPPEANLLYLDQNGAGVGMGTVLPAGKDTITAYFGAYAAPVTCMFTVSPAPLKITASPTTRVYGATICGLQSTYSGFQGNDGPDNLSPGPFYQISGRTVGAQTLVPYGAVDPNYDITNVPGPLTIVPAPLTVAVDVTSKYFGQANPDFTYTATGLVNGDNGTAITVGPRFATTCTVSSPVNNPYVPAYLVVASGAVAPNYTITYVTGWIYIKPGAPTPQPVGLTPVTPVPAVGPVPVTKVVVYTPVKVVYHSVVVHHPVKVVVHHPVVKKVKVVERARVDGRMVKVVKYLSVTKLVKKTVLVRVTYK